MNFIVKFPSNFRSSYPLAGKSFIAASGFFLLLSAYNYIKATSAENQIAYRKQQLQLPLYKLTSEEHIHPPWNKDNLKQWLYRRVQVTGRVIHRNTCLVPLPHSDGVQFQYVVPLLVTEDADRSNPQGLIISKGMIPWSARDIGIRYRIENSNKQTFVGFVSQLQELKNTHLFKGNTTLQDRIQFTSADTKDFAKAAGFVNEGAEVAVVQVLKETGVLDERNFSRRNVECQAKTTYPYAKTQSGALQLAKMPWHYKNDSKKYLISSFISFVFGASIF